MAADASDSDSSAFDIVENDYCFAVGEKVCHRVERPARFYRQIARGSQCHRRVHIGAQKVGLDKHDGTMKSVHRLVREQQQQPTFADTGRSDDGQHTRVVQGGHYPREIVVTTETWIVRRRKRVLPTAEFRNHCTFGDERTGADSIAPQTLRLVECTIGFFDEFDRRAFTRGYRCCNSRAQ